MPLEPFSTSKLEQLVEGAGLGRHRDALLKYVQPALVLNRGARGSGGVGASRVGGAPDLPEAEPWPLDAHGERMQFLLQVDLSAAPGFAASPLPSSGMLYAFIGQQGESTGLEHRVFIRAAEGLRDGNAVDDGSDDSSLDATEAYALRVSLIPDLPGWFSAEWEELYQRLGEQEMNVLEGKVRAPLRGEHCIGQLLGHVQGIEDDPRWQAYVERELGLERFVLWGPERRTLDLTPARRWRNLLRVESDLDVGFLFGDAGYVNVLIQPEDLEAGAFERGWADVESS